jgi:hypothetical protein
LEKKLRSLERLIFPLDDLIPAGANFKAWDKLDFDTPKIAATSLVLRASGEPSAKADWTLLLMRALTSAAVFAVVIELFVFEPLASALEVFELVPLEVVILFMFNSALSPLALLAFLTA